MKPAGLWELLRLVCVGGLRPRSRYWQWRLRTAWGGPGRPSRRELTTAAVSFGVWARRMRRWAR